MKYGRKYAIRQNCLDCQGQSKQEVKTCSNTRCSLWKFRLGVNPYSKKFISKNPYLEPQNFVGLENKSSSEVIKIIKSKGVQNSNNQ